MKKNELLGGNAYHNYEDSAPQFCINKIKSVSFFKTENLLCDHHHHCIFDTLVERGKKLEAQSNAPHQHIVGSIPGREYQNFLKLTA